jgi:hypothetical protein
LASADHWFCDLEAEKVSRRRLLGQAPQLDDEHAVLTEPDAQGRQEDQQPG